MARTTTRIFIAIGLALITAGLIWGGSQVLGAGRDAMVAERRFPVEYFLGSHLLWLLGGAVVAVILTIGPPANTKRPAGPLLAAATVPILMILPIYVWGSPDAPVWLRQIAVHGWLLSIDIQAGASVVAGVLLGSALWRRVASSISDDPDQTRN
jgi:hypothetical protein